MKVRMNEKQRSYVKTAVLVFSICLLIVFAVWRWGDIAAIFRKLIKVLAPILVGLALAYLLSPLQNWIEKQVQKLTDRKKEHPRLRRGISVALTMFVLLAIIAGLVASVVPELISSIKNLLVSLPEYLTSVTDWINLHIASLKDDQPQMYSVMLSVWDAAQNGLNNFADQFEPKLDSIASGGADLIGVVTSGAVSVFTWLTNFLLGIITSVYLLFNKEHYQAQARKLLYATLPEERVHGFLRIGSHVSYTFMHFLSGKTLDSVIIGLLCFIGMTILKMPYATLISILIGVTNIIPFFGPIIGAVPAGILILLSEPRKLIPFVIFILVIQQFDGNILGPKILGDSLGLPMFWILFAITVGGGLFGFIGMVAFVPLFAAVYTLFSDFLADRLQKKGLPQGTESYMTNEIHFADKAETPPEDDGEAEDGGTEDGGTEDGHTEDEETEPAEERETVELRKDTGAADDSGTEDSV